MLICDVAWDSTPRHHDALNFSAILSSGTADADSALALRQCQPGTVSIVLWGVERHCWAASPATTTTLATSCREPVQHRGGYRKALAWQGVAAPVARQKGSHAANATAARSDWPPWALVWRSRWRPLGGLRYGMIHFPRRWIQATARLWYEPLP